jgi:hypothetical protein
MSALGGGLKRSTQHFISDVRDGVDGQWSKICSRFQCGGQGGVAQQLNERSPETLGFETRAERDLMLVLHRPIEPTVISGHVIT